MLASKAFVADAANAAASDPGINGRLAGHISQPRPSFSTSRLTSSRPLPTRSSSAATMASKAF
eukprot:14661885-Heterocapsa_arctica.AAC.1